MTEEKHKTVHLTKKGESKTGYSKLLTTDKKIDTSGGKTVVTGRQTGRKWVLDPDDIRVIDKW